MNKEEKIERMMQAMLAKKTGDDSLKLKGFERFYLFTNEHLNVFLKRIDVREKRVLTVGSSGDQILYSLLNGAREVVCVDVCPFAEYYYNLKVACIKNLSYEEFVQLVDASENILSPEVYRKISHDIYGESREFWDNLYLEGFNHYEFLINRANVKLMGNAVYMNNKSEYNKLQNILRVPQAVLFLEADIRELPEILHEEDKYDVMLFSNIIQYAHSWNGGQTQECGEYQFLTIMKKLVKNLNPNGVMQIDYAYKNRLGKYKKYTKLLGGQISSAAVSFQAGPIVYRPNSEQEVAEM